MALTGIQVKCACLSFTVYNLYANGKNIELLQFLPSEKAAFFIPGTVLSFFEV